MSRIAIPTRDDAPDASKPFLDAVNKQLGSVPNLFRLVALSPAALAGMTGLSRALTKALDVKTRERIALAVAQVNGCDYCLSAHTYLGLNLAKISPEESPSIARARSADAKADAAVRFAAKVARERGHVSDADLAAVREAGFTDAQIIEIVGLVAENVFTNFSTKSPRPTSTFRWCAPPSRADGHGAGRVFAMAPAPHRSCRRFAMAYRFSRYRRTPSVRAAQAANGSAAIWERSKGDVIFDRLTEAEVAFIARARQFLPGDRLGRRLALCSAPRRPARLPAVLDDKTLGFADFRGNRQYISLGNLGGKRPCVFVPDGLPAPPAR